ncbi:DsbA family oxidoreductase [Acinetobacter tibetensis]|uniref:DsbA family oxidoreductase n=1 Tax=Acinetobacter tibetensis TaxID=2943497 RepID=UPI003A4DDB73
MTHEINIEVFFDFICPWCLIGKRQLQVAIEKLRHSHPDVVVKLHWKGVQLLPHIPTDGVPFEAFYLKRLGSTAAIKMRQAQVHQAAKAVSMDFNLDRIQRMPNTEKVHSFFINVAKFGSAEQNESLLEGLFSAYFMNAENIGDPAVLDKIASYCGYTDETIKAALRESAIPFLSTDTGGKGVPYFIFNASYAMAGAQTAEKFYQAMFEVLMDRGQVA